MFVPSNTYDGVKAKDTLRRTYLTFDFDEGLIQHLDSAVGCIHSKEVPVSRFGISGGASHQSVDVVASVGGSLGFDSSFQGLQSSLDGDVVRDGRTSEGAEILISSEVPERVRDRSHRPKQPSR